MSNLIKVILILALVHISFQIDAAGLARANSLIGQSRGNYVCNQVVNYALTGKKDGPLAKDYLNYGSKVTGAPRPGDVVVGNDGKHVGIFTGNNQFIHSSVSKYQVVPAGPQQLQYVFPSGYQVRRK